MLSRIATTIKESCLTVFYFIYYLFKSKPEWKCLSGKNEPVTSCCLYGKVHREDCNGLAHSNGVAHATSNGQSHNGIPHLRRPADFVGTSPLAQKTTVLGKIKSGALYIWSCVKRTVEWLWSGVKSIVSAPKAGLKYIWSRTRSVFEWLWSSVKTIVSAPKAVAVYIWSRTRSVFEWMWRGVKTVRRTTVRVVKKTVEVIVAFFSALFFREAPSQRLPPPAVPPKPVLAENGMALDNGVPPPPPPPPMANGTSKTAGVVEELENRKRIQNGAGAMRETIGELEEALRRRTDTSLDHSVHEKKKTVTIEEATAAETDLDTAQLEKETRRMLEEEEEEEVFDKLNRQRTIESKTQRKHEEDEEEVVEKIDRGMQIESRTHDQRMHEEDEEEILEQDDYEPVAFYSTRVFTLPRAPAPFSATSHGVPDRMKQSFHETGISERVSNTHGRGTPSKEVKGGIAVFPPDMMEEIAGTAGDDDGSSMGRGGVSRERAPSVKERLRRERNRSRSRTPERTRVAIPKGWSALHGENRGRSVGATNVSRLPDTPSQHEAQFVFRTPEAEGARIGNRRMASETTSAASSRVSTPAPFVRHHDEGVRFRGAMRESSQSAAEEAEKAFTTTSMSTPAPFVRRHEEAMQYRGVTRESSHIAAEEAAKSFTTTSVSTPAPFARRHEEGLRYRGVTRESSQSAVDEAEKAFHTTSMNFGTAWPGIEDGDGVVTVSCKRFIEQSDTDSWRLLDEAGRVIDQNSTSTKEADEQELLRQGPYRATHNSSHYTTDATGRIRFENVNRQYEPGYVVESITRNY